MTINFTKYSFVKVLNESEYFIKKWKINIELKATQFLTVNGGKLPQ